jgi:hypothetical protein
MNSIEYGSGAVCNMLRFYPSHIIIDETKLLQQLANVAQSRRTDVSVRAREWSSRALGFMIRNVDGDTIFNDVIAQLIKISQVVNEYRQIKNNNSILGTTAT